MAREAGARFSFLLSLPSVLAAGVFQLYKARHELLATEHDALALSLAFGLLAVAGLLVKPAQDALLALFGKKTTAVMTNVPGPREKLKFCGASLEQTMFWVPQSGDIGLGVSIPSWGGGAQFGPTPVPPLAPAPKGFTAHFDPGSNRLSMVTMMLPWGEGTP